ncbi:MAG: hypothetical protein QGG53_06210 [Planctomycetota bacterium]|jgi:hypothetical protein|nr:hypothetical protein [Planctomycetota bacterium]
MFRKLIPVSLIISVACAATFTTGLFAGDDESRYSDEVKGMSKDIPKRPEPLIELLQGYQRPGRLDYEIELPTGMVLSPNLTVYGVYRTGPQAVNNGVDPTRVEWVHELSLFSALTLTHTERVVVGMAPLQEGGSRSKHIFEPDDEKGTVNKLNGRITSLFFEGDLSEMLPKLDWEGRRPLDYGIAVGRQPVLIQDGFLIADLMDSVAITRNTIPFGSAAFGRLTFLYGWNEINRSNNAEVGQTSIYGLFSGFDLYSSTVELDTAFLDSTDAAGDQFNIALSAVQPIIVLGTEFNTTFRVAHSAAVDDETAQATDGTLFHTNISWAPKTTHNIAYVNAFWAVDQYAPASRSVGGPLGRAGLLFAGNGLASGSPISNLTNETFGGSVGYQMFLTHDNRRNLILEASGKVDDSPTGFSAFGIGGKISQAIGHHALISVDIFGIEQESRENSYGLRSELTIKF